MEKPPKLKLADALDENSIGREARAQSTDHGVIKLWLRLLSCSTQIEQEIRSRLRQRFETTLPRFDYLAQLERYPEGLRMSALSRYLMVTGGNVTGLTDQLVSDGWVQRAPDSSDRRSMIVKITVVGRKQFLLMAEAHEAWLVEMLDGFGIDQRDALYELLGQFRVHLARQEIDALSEKSSSPGKPRRNKRKEIR
jgi:DNA-binding MarR family transcriptional regulator